jgi:septal ring factor EnvC (AmiA/AmiB activator)
VASRQLDCYLNLANEARNGLVEPTRKYTYRSITSNVENLVLEQLRVIRSDIADARVDLRELTGRVHSLEVAIGGLRRDIGAMAADSAETGGRIDRLSQRIERVEMRLGLNETSH